VENGAMGSQFLACRSWVLVDNLRHQGKEQEQEINSLHSSRDHWKKYWLDLLLRPGIYKRGLNPSPLLKEVCADSGLLRLGNEDFRDGEGCKHVSPGTRRCSTCRFASREEGQHPTSRWGAGSCV